MKPNSIDGWYFIDKYYFSEECMKDPKTSVVFLYLLALRSVTAIKTESLCEKTGLSFSEVAIALLKLSAEKFIKITGIVGTSLIFVKLLYNEDDNADRKGGTDDET